MTRLNDYLQNLKVEADVAYEVGKPIMPDHEYDAIFGESSAVGVSAGEVPHLFPMYSLQKYYAEDGQPPITGVKLVETPKLDGCAVSLLYVSGKLSRALTRGNGKIGKEITDKLEFLAPKTIDCDEKLLQITGEIVSLSSVENSRNFSAGLLNTKSWTKFQDKAKEGNTIFVAYSVKEGTDKEGLYATYCQDMQYLEDLGFRTVVTSFLEDYPTDGIVYRMDNNIEFERAGFTSKHPRGAYAFKERQKPVTTILKDVIWQVGKSGKVTPIAILAPVVIGEATVSRATLNNMAYIQALELEIGCEVEVLRAGEIIPQIVGKVY